MCSSVNLCTTNATWTGPGQQVGLVSKNVLCYIIPCVINKFFLLPLIIPNGCPLFYKTLPRLQHTYVVCLSPRCIHLSFPNGSTISLTNISIYKSLLCTKISHLHNVNWWAVWITILQWSKLPPTWSLLVLKIETFESSSDYSHRFKTLHQ